MGGQPIILTAIMGTADFAWADGLRRRHYPPERNLVPAHVTLFHQLPPFVEGELLQRMKLIALEPAPAARLTGLVNLGTGVAYRIESPALLAIRAELAEAFHGLLTQQDIGVPRLHLTIQNKVDPAEARSLHAELAAQLRPRPLAIAGLAAWRYRGGPWELAGDARFRGQMG